MKTLVSIAIFKVTYVFFWREVLNFFVAQLVRKKFTNSLNFRSTSQRFHEKPTLVCSFQDGQIDLTYQWLPVLDCTKEVRDQYVIPLVNVFRLSPDGIVDADRSDDNCLAILLESFKLGLRIPLCPTGPPFIWLLYNFPCSVPSYSMKLSFVSSVSIILLMFLQRSACFHKFL